MNIKDHILEFEGFARSIRSYCHIRLAYNSERSDSKFVVVCSQLPNYHGTSVTNAFESVAKTLLEDKLLGSKIFDADVENWSNWLMQLAVQALPLQARNEKSIISEFVKFLKDRSLKSQLIPWTEFFEYPNFIWIERYPPGVGLRGGVEDLSRVELTDGSGTPSWNHFGPDDLNQVTGYNAQDLLCPVEELLLAHESFLRAGAQSDIPNH
ncbi:hypothetical protein [uncultured Propionivibrio sp.]|uniref:hypothetical protein n=1 Tax=uncultured Propionivibrio sp. TaxID=426737 RepID=UPI0029C03E50|nr:hypothetical protein [uncultured Propionivibrio sp.]